MYYMIVLLYVSISREIELERGSREEVMEIKNIILNKKTNSMREIELERGSREEVRKEKSKEDKKTV